MWLSHWTATTVIFLWVNESCFLYQFLLFGEHWECFWLFTIRGNVLIIVFLLKREILEVCIPGLKNWEHFFFSIGFRKLSRRLTGCFPGCCSVSATLTVGAGHGVSGLKARQTGLCLGDGPGPGLSPFRFTAAAVGCGLPPPTCPPPRHLSGAFDTVADMFHHRDPRVEVATVFYLPV